MSNRAYAAALSPAWITVRPARPARSLTWGGAVGLVGVLAAAHLVNDVYAFLLPAILPVVVPGLGLSLGAAGALVALYQLISSVLQPVLGHLADRRRLWWPVWVGLALSGVGGGLLGVAPSYLALVGLVLLAAVGTALFHPASAAVVGAAADEGSRGRWLGLYVSAGFVGTVLGPLAVGLIVERTGPGGLWPSALLVLALALALARVTPRRRDGAPPGPRLRDTLRRHGRFLGALTAVASVRAWVYVTTATFIPLLGYELGLGLGGSVQSLTVFLAGGAVGSLVGGVATDRLDATRLTVGSLLLNAPTVVYLALAEPSGPVFFAGAAASGFLLTGAFTVLTVFGQQRLPASAGVVTGLVTGLSTGLGGLAVAPIAAFADHAGLPTALTLATLLGTAAAVAAWVLAFGRSGYGNGPQRADEEPSPEQEPIAR